MCGVWSSDPSTYLKQWTWTSLIGAVLGQHMDLQALGSSREGYPLNESAESVIKEDSEGLVRWLSRCFPGIHACILWVPGAQEGQKEGVGSPGT